MEPTPPVSRNPRLTVDVLMAVNWLWIYTTICTFGAQFGGSLWLYIAASALIYVGLILWKNRKMKEIDERDTPL